MADDEDYDDAEAGGNGEHGRCERVGPVADGGCRRRWSRFRAGFPPCEARHGRRCAARLAPRWQRGAPGLSVRVATDSHRTFIARRPRSCVVCVSALPRFA
jgi:hypothetical protein